MVVPHAFSNINLSGISLEYGTINMPPWAPLCPHIRLLSCDGSPENDKFLSMGFAPNLKFQHFRSLPLTDCQDQSHGKVRKTNILMK